MSATLVLDPLADLRPAWQNRAACRGGSVGHWFPEKHEGAGSFAKRICADCPVKQECLDYALEHGIGHGTWGGLSPEDRQGLRRERRRTG